MPSHHRALTICGLSLYAKAYKKQFQVSTLTCTLFFIASCELLFMNRASHLASLKLLRGDFISFHFSFHFIFNSLDMVAPQIQGSGLQGTMLKTSI